jgi:hypothetical protein
MLTPYFDVNRNHEFTESFIGTSQSILLDRLMENSSRKRKTPFSMLEESSRLILLRENATFFVFS